MVNCLNYTLDTGYQVTTLIELLRYRAQNQPNQKAYTFLHRGVDEAGTLTYQGLEDRSRAIAAYLQSLDAAGERALLLYQPGLDYIAAFFGCLYAGVIAVPAYPPRRNQNLSRLQSIVSDSQASIALTTSSILEGIERKFAENPDLIALKWVTSDRLSDDIAQSWKEPQVNQDTIAFLQYTSGSTGNPKGVTIAHGNLLHNLRLIHQGFGHSPESQGAIWLPPYHDMGLIGGVLQPLYGGFPVTLMSPVDFLQKPLRWLEAISHYRATTSGGPNFAYDLCARKVKPEQLETLDLSSWEVAFNGAEPVRADTLERFAEVFEPCGFRREAFYPCYGMAETTLIVSGGIKTEPPVIRQVSGMALEQHQVVAPKHSEDTRTIVGCGQSCPELAIAIVDPETLTPCSSNQVGEIWVAGPSIALGYWNRTDVTKETFQAYLKDGEEGPFLRTGDLGFLQDGELFITGRLKDVIIIRGQNHYPHDIELTVENAHPALKVGAGAAFAVEVKDSEKLVIVQEVERNFLRSFDLNEVVGNIRQAIATQHDLQAYAIVLVKPSSIPKTSSGKIQRYACREGFLKGTLSVVADWSENPQAKSEFMHLQAEVESMLQTLQAGKQS